MKELGEDTFKLYDRLGHINEGTLSDQLALRVFEQLKGEILPDRWRYVDPDTFIEKFGDEPMWSITKSYHCYMTKGRHMFRMWTNADTPYMWVDVDVSLSGPLQPFVETHSIPDGSRHKCRPLLYRCKLTTIEEADFLVKLVRSMYGLHQ